MRQEMTTATFACKTKLVHPTPFGCFLCGRCEIDQLIFLRSSILFAEGFDQTEKPFPFACDRQIARVTPDWDWEVHMFVLLRQGYIRFSLCAE
jgi:hypothetical protein